ncbi:MULTISPECIES: DUF4291 domain-containing protein [Rhizobium/Agrobacterium group]|uniref:DUF4291 domain-containing protein n=1 Tax=Rhizobium/Agrobacterium group TaxID=227290 RepID=UPI00191F1D60|nr:MULTISPECIES: DUF4291 domain-containing protein [Rhizobium/Agrobacterium group]
MTQQIRAVFDEHSIRIYQAFGDAIADAALNTGTLSPPTFSLDRMTWIKPSFLWMMYRCGWGEKSVEQKRILAIDIKRSGFEEALEAACLSRFDPRVYSSVEEWKNRLKRSPVRVQWDPERDVEMQPLGEVRSLQVGLSGQMVLAYATQWTTSIRDISSEVAELNHLRKHDMLIKLQHRLPKEKIYPLPQNIAKIIGVL